MAVLLSLSSYLCSSTSISRHRALPRSVRLSPPFLLSLSPLPSLPRRRGLFLSLPKPFPTPQRPVKAVAEGETEALEREQAAETLVAAAEEGATVAIPVSPSDMLTMFFQAEGTMDELAVPTVIGALEGSEGVSALSVRVAEGIATVELTKQTTVQATGVASSLVEIIQGAGFKLQTLYLSFEDEEDTAVSSVQKCDGEVASKDTLHEVKVLEQNGFVL